MPLKRKPTRARKKKTCRSQKSQATPAQIATHQLFFPMLIFTAIVWFLYRSLFNFPVWFDEIIGKAIFFGLPVWVYINVTGFRPIIDTFRLKKLQPGLMQGLLFGGIFGLVTMGVRFLQTGYHVRPLLLFLDNKFWWEMLLALFTAFWETIFFFSFVMTVVQDRFAHWSLLKQIVLTALVFLVFHIPNSFLRFDLGVITPLLSLLALFAIGQALLFSEKQNAYLLIMTHMIWGMVLLVYF